MNGKTWTGDEKSVSHKKTENSRVSALLSGSPAFLITIKNAPNIKIAQKVPSANCWPEYMPIAKEEKSMNVSMVYLKKPLR